MRPSQPFIHERYDNDDNILCRILSKKQSLHTKQANQHRSERTKKLLACLFYNAVCLFAVSPSKKCSYCVHYYFSLCLFVCEKHTKRNVVRELLLFMDIALEINEWRLVECWMSLDLCQAVEGEVSGWESVRMLISASRTVDWYSFVLITDVNSLHV